MTGVEIAILVIAGLGTLISGSIGLNIGLTLPERITTFRTKRKHNNRTDDYNMHHIYANHTGPLYFAAICDYINCHGKEMTFSESGTTTIQTNLQGTVYAYNVPLAGTDIKFTAYGDLKITALNESFQDGTPDRFVVYYNSESLFNSWKEEVIAPFVSKYGSVVRSQN